MSAFKNYFLCAFDFVGVTNRKNFWIVFSAILGLFAISFALCFVAVVFQYISIIIFLILIIPTLSLIVRRLHDTDRGAIYLLWWLLPLIGQIIIFIFLFERTKYYVK